MKDPENDNNFSATLSNSFLKGSINMKTFIIYKIINNTEN